MSAQSLDISRRRFVASAGLAATLLHTGTLGGTDTIHSSIIRLAEASME